MTRRETRTATIAPPAGGIRPLPAWPLRRNCIDPWPRFDIRPGAARPWPAENDRERRGGHGPGDARGGAAQAAHTAQDREAGAAGARTGTDPDPRRRLRRLP